jgi:hypothetical protein
LSRTQEFGLRCSSNDEKSHREIIRQQYDFSPPDTTTEREDYSEDLDSVTNLELLTIPTSVADMRAQALRNCALGRIPLRQTNARINVRRTIVRWDLIHGG